MTTRPSLIAQRAPRVAAFDVNETLSDLSGLESRLQEVGAPADLLPKWFAATLRDGFALTASGGLADFAEIGRFTLTSMLADVEDLHGSPEEAAEDVVSAMAELDLHTDVAPGLRSLAEAGVRIVTLSNGAAHVAESLLERAGLRDLVERCLTVNDAGRWKPAHEAYAYATRLCAVRPAEMMLVAVHPWDIDGATRAGLRTGWLARGEPSYPPYFHAPELSGGHLPELVAKMIGGRP